VPPPTHLTVKWVEPPPYTAAQIVLDHSNIIVGSMAQPIPPSLSQLVALNVEYSVLICTGNGCRRAVRPAGLAAHVRRKHSVPKGVWKQVEQYIREFPFEYDYSSVPLPADGLPPQPIVQVVDGFQCKHCQHRSQNRSNIRQHANQAHNKKRVKDEEIFQSVRLQSWFWDGKERYWVVDESQGPPAHRRAAIGDVGEASDDSEPNAGSGSDSEGSQDEVDDQIVREIENWKEEAKERRLRALKDVPAVEMDSWLQYTKWNEVLGQSKHNLVRTFQFTREPDPDEPELGRVLRAWSRIFDRCLDTLAATDQKDALKWWASPKNEAASQRPFELPQNAKSVEKYSAVWERFICYMMRTAPKEHWEQETGG
jgi:hypothetical protein